MSDDAPSPQDTNASDGEEDVQEPVAMDLDSADSDHIELSQDDGETFQGDGESFQKRSDEDTESRGNRG